MQIPWGEDWTFQMLMGDLINAAQTFLKFGVQYVGAALTVNMLKGVNALRCAVNNVGENSWNLIAAAYWAAVGAGKQEMIKGYLDIGYMHICTCKEDAKAIVAGMGGDQDGGRSAYMLGSCSETGRVKGGDAERARMARVEEKIAANMRALKQKAYNRIKERRQKEMEQMMAEKGDAGRKALERKQLEAFRAFKKEAKRL